MRPVLLHIDRFNLTLPSFGVFLALGFLLSLVFLYFLCSKKGENFNLFLSLFLYVVLATLVGSRLIHVFLGDPGYYLKYPIEIFQIWRGGYSFLGGLIPAFLAIWIFAKKYNLPLLPTLDLLTLAFLPGQILGYFGSFFAGSYFGRDTTMPWGVSFLDPKTYARPIGVPLHPTQLYQAFTLIILLFFLLSAFQKKEKPGKIFALYLFYFGLTRGIVDFFLAESCRTFLIPNYFSSAQLFSIFMMATAIFLLKKIKA